MFSSTQFIEGIFYYPPMPALCFSHNGLLINNPLSPYILYAFPFLYPYSHLLPLNLYLKNSLFFLFIQISPFKKHFKCHLFSKATSSLLKQWFSTQLAF